MSAAARAPILLLSLFLAGIAVPSRAGEVKLPARGEIEDALPEGVSLSGREIFDRFLDKRQLGFPMVVSRGRSNDPFIGSPATGRVGRVRLSGVGIMASWVRLMGAGSSSAKLVRTRPIERRCRAPACSSYALPSFHYLQQLQ